MQHLHKFVCINDCFCKDIDSNNKKFQLTFNDLTRKENRPDSTVSYPSLNKSLIKIYAADEPNTSSIFLFTSSPTHVLFIYQHYQKVFGFIY